MRSFENVKPSKDSSAGSRQPRRLRTAAVLAMIPLLSACGADTAKVAVGRSPSRHVSAPIETPTPMRTKLEAQQRREALAGTCVRLLTFESRSPLTATQWLQLSPSEQAVIRKDAAVVADHHGKLYSSLELGNQIDLSQPDDGGVNLGLDPERQFLVNLIQFTPPKTLEQRPSQGFVTNSSTTLGASSPATHKTSYQLQINSAHAPVSFGDYSTARDGCWT